MGLRNNPKTAEKMYVHYGSRYFDREKFREVKNIEYGMKPVGGLWASLVDADYSWKQWCIDNEFRENNEDNCFYFRVRGWQVYEVETLEDLNKLPHIHLPDKYKQWFSGHERFLDFETMSKGEFSYSGLEIKIKDVEDEMSAFSCDCILMLNSRDIVENFDARISNNPLTLHKLLPFKWYKTIMGDVEVCGLLRTPEGKQYVYCEQPDEHYGFRTLVACISDERIVEACGYSEEEAKSIVFEVIKYKDELMKLISDNRKDG